MERATKALKRGSIRLKSYSEINLILSDLDGMRSHGKSGVKAHQMFVEDLIKWAHREPHEGLKNLFALLTELNVLWTDIHNEYFDNLKKFKNQFELILESEQNVDKAKSNLQDCERNEAKIKKRLSDSYSGSVEDRLNTEEKLKVARRALDFAKLEVTEKISENEIIKLIRVKEGLKKLTDSYISLSQKCNVVLQAQKAIVKELPDEVGVNHELQFASDCKAKQALARAKTIIQALGCSSNMVEACAPSEYEAPPPYSPFFNVPNTSNHRSSIRSMPSTSSASNSNSAEMPSLGSAGWSQNNGMLIFNGGCSTEPKTYVCCKCASQMISDHRYVQVHDNATSLETQLTTSLQNTRIS